MGTNMPEAIVTPEEKKYRDVYYPGISSVKKRDLFCSSCGNRISYDADNYSSHPFLGTLQCQPCSDQFKFLKSTVTKIKAWKKKCLMCGSDQCQTLFPCPVKNCPYSFCQNCIKRNAPNSLLLADTPKWKCYVCETNPLWQARGACAILLSASPRRRKRQKLVQADSSEDDDIEDIVKIQKANLKNTIKSRRTMKSSSIMTSVRRTRTSSQSVSRSSDPQEAEEDSEDEIEILPGDKLAKKNKKKEKSQKLLKKRKISSDKSSSMSRSISPELSGHSSQTSNKQISSTTTITTTTATTTKHTSSLSSELKKPPLQKKSSSSLLALRRENSDSSSGKEFTQTKLIRESYVPLQRLSIGEKDYTHSPDIKNHEDKTLTEQQTFPLKNHVFEFLKELKATSKRMSDAADQLQRHYAMKDSMKSLDATKLIAECKNTISSLRQNLDNNEKKLIKKFGVWCDKTKIKNIFINLTSIDDDDSPRPINCGSMSKNDDAKLVVPQSSSDDDDDDDDDDNNNAEEKTKDNNHDKREISRISNASLDVTPEVSDCESDEIFTQIKGTKKTISPINEDFNDKCKTGGNNIDPELPPSPVSAESIVSNNSLHRIDQEVSNDNNSNNNNNNNYNNNDDGSSNDMFSDESDKENEGVAAVAATKDDHDSRHLSHSSNTREELGRISSMSRTEEEKPGRKREEEILQDTTAISTDKRTMENNRKSRGSWIEAADDAEKLTKLKCQNSVKLKTSYGTQTAAAAVHSKNEKYTISHGNFPSSSDEEGNDMTSDGSDKINVPERRRKVSNEAENAKKIDDTRSSSREEGNEKVNVSSSSVVADVKKKTDDNNDDSSLNELISASSEEEEKASAKHLFSTKNNSESEKTGNTKKSNKSNKKKENKMEPAAAASLQRTLSDLEEKRAKESLLRCDATSEEDTDNDNVELITADSSLEKSKEEENALPLLSKGDDDDDDDFNKVQYNDKDISNDKPTEDDEENSKESDSSAEASNAQPDRSLAKKSEKIDSSLEKSRVKKSRLLLLQSDSSSDEAEAGLSHPPHVSSKKSTKIVENSSMVVDSCAEEIKKDSSKLSAGESLEQLEENLKKNLLASDSSSSDDNESEKKESQSSIERTAEQLKEKEKRNTLSYFSDEEERARNDLLNSDVSLTDDMTTTTTTKTTIMDTLTSLFDSEKKAKETLLNSSFSDEPKNVTPEKSKSKIHKQADTFAGLSSDSANDNDGKIKLKNVGKKKLSSDENSNDMFAPPKAKGRKLHLKYNKFYKSDKKLGLCCKVMVERLPNRILRRHAKALKKSKEYLEDKALKSLTSLRHLENARKKDCGNGSDSDDTSTTSRHKKKSLKKPEGDTLMDHLNVNGEKVDNDVISSSGGGGGGGDDDDDNTSQKVEKLYESGNLLEEAEAMTKNNLLETSDEEKIQEISSDDDDEEEQPQKPQSNKGKKEQSNKKRKSIEEIDETDDCKRIEKCEWKKSKLLTIKLSSSDEEEKSQKFEKKAMKLSQKQQSNDDDSNNEDGCDASDDGDGSKKKKKKKRIRRRRLNSDSDIQLTDESQSQTGDDNDDDDDDGNNDDKKKGKKGKKRVKKFDNSSDSSSSSTARSRPKPKRRRVRTANTDSDSDIEEINNSQGSPNKSGGGRKNIRKVMKDKQVADDTKEAAKQEEERLKRMAERQKLYNELYEARLAGEEKVDKLILDFDEESKEELLSVDEGLVKRLKPHQAQGIKFMWDACYESIERAKSTKGSGCILAHCMGLGKSFQVVTLTHTLLSNYEKTNVKTVLVVCPLSTVLNWVNEFKIWLKELNNDGGDDDDDEVEVYELTKFKKNFERKYQLDRWQRTGGVLIMGYEMYRNLSNPTKKLQKKLKESFFKCLVNPGPDLVVCDEGHLLKSEATAISKAMSKIQTLRRIVLTGTPLQNNLTEYHCMVQFVKPNLLGTRKEFLNRFVNPIQNGQFDDSTEYDVKLMKKRAHVLHKMLEGSVQRFDYSVLTPFLPPKQEYVIFVKLTDVQVKLYEYYIENFARKHRGAGGSLFADFQALQRIWTHPIAIKLNADKAAEKKMTAESDSEGSLKDFIDDDSSSSESSSSKSDNSVISTNSSISKKKKNEADIKRGTRANPVIEIPDDDDEQQQQSALPLDTTNFEWWKQFVEDEHFEDLRISSKLRILFEILKECEHIGDKLLVFSQSLYSLTLIERFLAMIDEETQNGNTSDFIDGHTGSWTLGSDYFRLDGQTSTENRSAWCNLFNKPSNTRARLFLISTRAGGLGINLTAANRVIIFDASWNPSHDVQSIFRIYRFGQKKPCYVYRLLAAGTMEEKIYNRQVTKLSLSCRVVDEQQIERHYTNSDLAELYTFDKPDEKTETIGCPKDRLLAEIFSKYKDIVRNFHEHDSLLENKAEEELDEEERKQAWLEYEQEKAGRPPINTAAAAMNNHYQDQMMLQFNQQLLNSFAHNGTTMNNELLNLQRLYEKDFPNMTPEQQKMMATKALMDMYSYVENHAIMSNRTISNSPMASNHQAQYPNPTNTLANQLAQQAYNRAHQGSKQMTAAQRQIQYAQQFGNFKTLPGATTTMIPQNSSTRPPPPVTQPPRAIITHDPDIIEITPSTTTLSNNAAQSSSSSTAQDKPNKYQEE